MTRTSPAAEPATGAAADSGSLRALEYAAIVERLASLTAFEPSRELAQELQPVADPVHAIPDYLAMIILIVVALTALSLFVRARLSVANPGPLQILLVGGVGQIADVEFSRHSSDSQFCSAARSVPTR